MVRSYLLPLVVIAGLLLPGTSFAQAPEARAKGLQKKAMDEDYLSTDFEKAAEKLKQAIALCGNDKCAPQLRANLRRDLAVVQIIGLNDKAKGTQSFIDALKIDSTTALDPDVKTRDLEAAFAEARKKAGLREGATGGTPTGAGGGTPTGDFNHSPVPQQLVRTPVPIYAESQTETPLVRVLARYKGFGMADWKPLELHKIGTGWGALVPCGDVQQGQFVYYLQGFDTNNDPIAVGGDRNNPYRVTIKTGKLDGEAPHLPNEAPPTQCVDTGDCPPGFPCAKKGGAGTVGPSQPEEEGKDAGASCDEDSECKSNKCNEGSCTEPQDKRTKIWFGLSAGFDFYNLGSDSDVCRLKDQKGPEALNPINTSGFYCTNANGGGDFPLRNDSGIENRLVTQGNGGKVNGGMAPATIRFLLSFDYALAANMMVGGRLGIAINGYTGTAYSQEHFSLAPFHVEGRFTYFFRKDALSEKGLSFYALGAVGASRFESSVAVPVTVQGEATKRDVKAWQISGPAFIGFGGGLRYAFSPKAALMLAPIKLNVAFPPAALTFSPELGVQIGF